MIRSLFDSGCSRYMPVILLATSLLSGCSGEDPEVRPTPRLVKVETVSTHASSGLRFIGTVRAQHIADLVFEEDGVMELLMVQAGQHVKKGQVLAQLDREPARLRLAQARAKLQAQQSILLLSQQEAERSKRLFADGTVSQQVVEQSEAKYKADSAELLADKAAVSAAERGYNRTQVTAPFDGRVVSSAEPHTRVAGGDPAVRMVSIGAQEIVALLPVDDVKNFSLGDVFDGAVEGQESALKLRLFALSPVAKGGALQEAKFEVSGEGVGLIDGSAIPVRLVNKSAAPAITLPTQSFRGEAGRDAQVFVYDAKSNTVLLRAVKVSGTSGARLIVSEGLSEGEQVVTAGAAFLSDHQAVSLIPAVGKDSDEQP